MNANQPQYETDFHPTSAQANEDDKFLFNKGVNRNLMGINYSKRGHNPP